MSTSVTYIIGLLDVKFLGNVLLQVLHGRLC